VGVPKNCWAPGSPCWALATPPGPDASTGLVEVGVVHAHAELAIGLGDDDRVGQALKVDDLPEEANLQHFLQLVADEVQPLGGLPTDLLLDRPRTGVHSEMVLDHLPGDPRHIRWFARDVRTHRR
jgi:hypothetical protein